MPTSTNFNPSIGYAGRIQAANLNAATALDFTNGLADLTVVSTPASNASVTRWEVAKQVTSGKVLTFESATDAATGVAWERSLVGGVGRWTVTIEGFQDGDATAPGVGGDNSDAFWHVGRYIKANLYYNKTEVYGLAGCFLKIMSYKAGSTAGPEANRFTIECEGDGAPPTPTLTSS